MSRVRISSPASEAPKVRGFFVPSLPPHEVIHMTFASLTYEQQIAQLTAAAQSILPHYNLANAQLELLSYANNAVFKVTAAPDAHYVLRMHRPGHKRIEWIRSEVIWLTTLNQHTTLQVPRPVVTQHGDWLVEAHVE